MFANVPWDWIQSGALGLLGLFGLLVITFLLKVGWKHYNEVILPESVERREHAKRITSAVETMAKSMEEIAPIVRDTNKRLRA